MQKRSWSIEVSSLLGVSSEALWQRVGTMRGVNDELWPWIRMTMPRDVASDDLSGLVLGKVAFHSWMLFLGFVPFDRHALCLLEFDPPSGFLESSSSWLHQEWRHERRLTSDGGATRIIDRVAFSPRFRPAGPLERALVLRLFQHRHRRLGKRFPLRK